MLIWLYGFAALVVTGVGLRIWYRHWKKKRIAARRVVEKPNSHYSSKLVQNQEDKERWHSVDLTNLHPVNREEVERLLEVVDVQGLEALSPKERLFLDNMARLRWS
jgi:hypothetical protein